MDHYVELHPTASGQIAERFWAVDANVAHLNIEPSNFGTFPADANGTALDRIKKEFPNSQFFKLTLGPGGYYPRIGRPGHSGSSQWLGGTFDYTDAHKHNLAISAGQLDALVQELKQIFRVVQPHSANFGAFGHEIRNLLIIACTEVEAQWKGILKANHAKADGRLDYVKLSSVMKLPEYCVRLPSYPWLDPVVPFERWAPTPPGLMQHLPWYDAYNAAKHDRETAFAQATLEYALKAVTGCHVMLCAQYGGSYAPLPEPGHESFFQLEKIPVWAPTDVYVGGGTPAPQDYPF